ncbi:RNA polymerase sigma factor [Inquilinus limosus]|uniref:RNA polymerase sigma factor n=1 Tax=Inquilinus limosus TaxID=171674 RepID=UPI003F1376C7
MEQAANSTDRCFDSTVMPHVPDLRRYALSLTRNQADADDLVQDTLLRAYVKLHLWQPGTNMIAWLVVMMRRLFLSNFVQGLRNDIQIVTIEDFDHPCDGSQEQRVELNELYIQWRRLTADHREVIRLVAVEEASYEEAAICLGLPVGTIRSRLHRAREALRSQALG